MNTMNITEQILYLVANAFHIYVFYCMFRAMLGVPKNQKVELAAFVGMYAVNSAAFLLFTSNYFNLLSSIVPLIIISLIYDRTARFKLLVSVMTCAVSMLLESVTTNILLLLIKNIGDAQTILSNIVGSFILFFLSLVVRKIRTSQKNTTLAISHWLVIFFVPSGSITVVALAFSSGYMAWQNVAIVTILLLINVIIFWLFDKMTDYYQARYERQLMSEQLYIFTQQLELINENNQAIRSMRHDLKNHITYLSEFLRRNEIDSAQEYLEQISEHLQPHNQYVDTGNPGLDSFINYKLSALEKISDKIETCMEIPKQISYPSFELCVILGNLLDNASEAFLRLPQDIPKLLSLDIRFDRGILFISVSNSFDGKLRKTLAAGKTVYHSLKENAEDHGRGLANVRNMVDAFEGELYIEDDQHKYTVKIVLFPKHSN